MGEHRGHQYGLGPGGFHRGRHGGRKVKDVAAGVHKSGKRGCLASLLILAMVGTIAGCPSEEGSKNPPPTVQIHRGGQ